MDLTRYLWYVSRFAFPPRILVATKVAVTIAPLFFVGGRHTGFPAYVSPTWLAQRGIGTGAYRNGRLELPVGIASKGLAILVDHGVLRRHARKGLLKMRHVHTLEPIDTWAWGPDERAVVDMDWAQIGTDTAWDGHDLIARELAPLVAAHPEVSWTPQDPAMIHFVKVGARLAERYGLDTLRQGIRAALEDPEAVTPFDALRFDTVFVGLVSRWRRQTRFAE